jgi:hypothetical protein
MEHERLIEYSNYAPIYNLKLMLKEIFSYLKPDSILSDFDEQRLNVGLLAAKALDFNLRFKKYALLLHDVWNGFLSFLNKPRAVPLLGDKRKAYNFYLSHGFSNNHIWGHLDGIDFRVGKDFDAQFRLNQHDIVAQWKALCIP